MFKVGGWFVGPEGSKILLTRREAKVIEGQNMRYLTPRTAWSRLAPTWASTSIDSRRLLWHAVERMIGKRLIPLFQVSQYVV
jgi:hypothetical protein